MEFEGVTNYFRVDLTKSTRCLYFKIWEKFDVKPCLQTIYFNEEEEKILDPDDTFLNQGVSSGDKFILCTREPDVCENVGHKDVFPIFFHPFRKTSIL